ncbi:MAG: alpha/beta hydrolase [Ferruginibacter sp.]
MEKPIELLKDSCHLIIPDLPGSGKSQMINDMSIEGMAATINAILNEEQIEQCTMFGHSIGGYITLAFCRKNEQRLTSFGLIRQQLMPMAKKKANRLKSIEFVKKNGAFEFLKAVIIDLFTETWYANNSNFVNELIEKSKALQMKQLYYCGSYD